MPAIPLKINFSPGKIVFSFIIGLLFSPPLKSQSVTELNDLSFFIDPGKSWSTAGGVTADLQKTGTLNTSRGTGIIVNHSDKKNQGADLYTRSEYGDVDVELDYLMAAGSNSGVYLQGRYEIQLHDTPGSIAPTSGTNGGIYERWDENLPDGQKGYQGYPPRQNSSRAPGLWQHLRISFKAPVFDARGKKTASAKILRVELNGVVIHENVELSGPTRGGVSQEEKAIGPLRLQGDHGSVAFRNIKITSYDNGHPLENESTKPNVVYPIIVKPRERPVFRSFMDLPNGIRVVHAISVATSENIHYAYDADTGMILQVWRGDFLDATPMWYRRGDGSSRPVGTIHRFGPPAPALAKLPSSQSVWKKDTTGTGFRSKGYVLNEDQQPVFQYLMYGSIVNDETKAMDNGRGIHREISIKNPGAGLYFRLAEATTIKELSKGMYLIGDNAYYLQLHAAGEMKPVVRNSGGKTELIVPVRNKLSYSIIF